MLSIFVREDKILNKLLFQELRLDGNRLKRVPTESLGGPSSLQNLHLQDNIIGECSERSGGIFWEKYGRNRKIQILNLANWVLSAIFYSKCHSMFLLQNIPLVLSVRGPTPGQFSWPASLLLIPREIKSMRICAWRSRARPWLASASTPIYRNMNPG